MLNQLIGQLQDKDANVRWLACQALGRLGDVRAVEPLIECLGDKNTVVRQAASWTLMKLGEVPLGKAFIGALSGYVGARGELRQLAAQVDVRAVDALIAWLEDSPSYARQTACEALNLIYKTLKIEEMLCRIHLTRFERKRKIIENIYSNMGVVIVHFVVCRICSKAGQAMCGVRENIATLDAGMEEEFVCIDGVARINWLKRGSLFDFERVEIVQASDYDVERFCVQVGDDMDGFRRAEYQQMSCIVDPKSGLSENTINILRSMFGAVSVESPA